jgi:hypothetical protein
MESMKIIKNSSRSILADVWAMGAAAASARRSANRRNRVAPVTARHG